MQKPQGLNSQIGSGKKRYLLHNILTCVWSFQIVSSNILLCWMFSLTCLCRHTTSVDQLLSAEKDKVLLLFCLSHKCSSSGEAAAHSCDDYEMNSSCLWQEVIRAILNIFGDRIDCSLYNLFRQIFISARQIFIKDIISRQRESCNMKMVRLNLWHCD